MPRQARSVTACTRRPASLFSKRRSLDEPLAGRECHSRRATSFHPSFRWQFKLDWPTFGRAGLTALVWLPSSWIGRPQAGLAALKRVWPLSSWVGRLGLTALVWLPSSGFGRSQAGLVALKRVWLPSSWVGRSQAGLAALKLGWPPWFGRPGLAVLGLTALNWPPYTIGCS